MRGCRDRVCLVLNQYYWPGVEATAQLLTELCEALADDFDVKVVTGRPHGHEDEPRRMVRNGVEIVRVPSTSFERSESCARGANYVTYLGNALCSGLRGAAARRRALHDRPADRRRRGAARCPPVPRAARRDQPGRLPGDRRRS